MKELIIARIQLYKEEGKSVWEDVEAYLKNKEYSVDDRWEVFLMTDHRDLDNVYAHPDGINWNTTTYYDDFYCDRYESITAEDMLKQGNKSEVIYDEDAFKEWWLQSHYSGCVNDW